MKIRLPYSKKSVEITKDQEEMIVRRADDHIRWKKLSKRERENERKKKAEQHISHFPTPLAEPRFRPGDDVMLWASSRNPYSRKEYGRVILSVWNKFLGTWDVYVAFFGVRWPSKDERKLEKPYVLRYLEGSLLPFKPKKETIK